MTVIKEMKEKVAKQIMAPDVKKYKGVTFVTPLLTDGGDWYLSRTTTALARADCKDATGTGT